MTKILITNNGNVLMEEGENSTFCPITNQPALFVYLLSKHFDLFGLIKSGQAAIKTSIV